MKDSDLLREQDVDTTSTAKRSNSGRGAVSDSLIETLAIFMYNIISVKEKEKKMTNRAFR